MKKCPYKNIYCLYLVQQKRILACFKEISHASLIVHSMLIDLDGKEGKR
jgi:hypothetical protein